MSEVTNNFFMSEGPLTPNDAAVALVIVDGSRYLMQLRDQKPGIFYPGHWGCFGGGIEPGETPEAALRRELREELHYQVEKISYFTRFSFDFTCLGSRPVERHYYVVKVSSSELLTMDLGEGSAMRDFSGDDLLANEKITPYDAFAIWMHRTQTALGAS